MSDWSHVIPSSLSSTLTASSFPPANATKWPVSYAGIMWHKSRKERPDYKFSSPFHYVTHALQNKRSCVGIIMTSDSKLRAAYICNEGFWSIRRFVILLLFYKLQGKSQSIFIGGILNDGNYSTCQYVRERVMICIKGPSFGINTGRCSKYGERMISNVTYRHQSYDKGIKFYFLSLIYHFNLLQRTSP